MKLATLDIDIKNNDKIVCQKGDRVEVEEHCYMIGTTESIVRVYIPKLDITLLPEAFVEYQTSKDRMGKYIDQYLSQFQERMQANV